MLAIGIQFSLFLSNADAMNRGTQCRGKSSDFGPTDIYCKSEISVLVRDSVNIICVNPGNQVELAWKLLGQRKVFAAVIDRTLTLAAEFLYDLTNLIAISRVGHEF